MVAVDPFGVLAAGHLEAVGSAGELHRVDAQRGYVLDRDAAPAEQVRRAGQDLHGGHAASQGQRELGVLGPDRVLGPDLGGVGVGSFVAVGIRRHRRRSIDAEMGVRIDQSRGHPLAGGVDHLGIAGRGGNHGIGSHGGDLAVAEQHRGALEPLAGGGEHGGVGHEDRREGLPAVG